MPDHAAPRHLDLAAIPPPSLLLAATTGGPFIPTLDMLEARAVTAAAALCRTHVPAETEAATDALVDLLRPARPDQRRLIGAAMVELALERIRHLEA
jgi:hypothetical protein